jgi:hypothetical protein
LCKATSNVLISESEQSPFMIESTTCVICSWVRDWPSETCFVASTINGTSFYYFIKNSRRVKNHAQITSPDSIIIARSLHAKNRFFSCDGPWGILQSAQSVYREWELMV